ncbi:MAG TPA: hypothetical protein VKQ72_05350 [Aggregatilineales bacterium]|nr:hypothetical protein [Aggregatilineales bacterium]
MNSRNKPGENIAHKSQIIGIYADLGLDHQHILALFGNGVIQVLAGYEVIAVVAIIGTLAVLIGFGRLQPINGPSLIQRKDVAHAVAQDSEATLIIPI